MAVIPDQGLCERPDPTRRRLLAGGAVLAVWPFVPRFAQAAGGRDPRMVTIILRGALDGLSAVAPLGDPDYAALRQGIALGLDGPNPAFALDGFFALHPAMPTFARLYRYNQALVVHATATPYRERSHFDGQDVLESGQPGPGLVASGWMNRALGALPTGDRVAARGGIGIGAVTPLVMRGETPVLGWTPPSLPKAGDDLAARVLDLYRHADPALGEILGRGLGSDRIARDSGLSGDAAKARGGSATAEGMKAAAAGAARLIAADDGPRLAAMAFDGWDTHANEGGATGRLAQLLGGLDGAIAAFEAGLGDKWRDTVLLVLTEFGRTARVNGTVGTDHGTATVALLAGGAVKGGRILADWPGLRPETLHQERDLKPTTDLRAVIKGVMAEHLGLSAGVLGATVFPDSAAVKPLSGLIA
ncbi:DUF1501 domain-containing protein [Prosthecomicrobium sp. N25]|uniref:DUF1501 domain-containing protein n=1 Tax=Prosthecomicrobium sp. N25 TaxID=3129254 RepID=UPI0030785D5C